VRRGTQGESYVFNSVGQELDVADLVIVCDQSSPGGRAVGSPIKDSMAGKIEASDNHLIAIVYAPANAQPALEHACQMLTEHFVQYLQGARVARVPVS
jgi:DNA/RNA-binding domain of Phe-tRNA-synthetase-like protein